MPQFVLDILLWLSAVFWLRAAWLMLREVRQLHVLPPYEAAPEKPPHVSVLIAARNEADVIAETIRILLAQQHIDLEVIVASDRSTDGTADELRQLAEVERRVRAVVIDQLPDGWLGKCYALHRAAEQAAGDWLLFTDADVRLAPDAIARAIQHARREQVEHVTAWFNSHEATLIGAAAWLSFVLGGLPDHTGGVNRDRPGAFAGTGAFNLVRASAYRECGGHEALRLTVFEDVKLGLLMRRAGFRTRLLLGGTWVTADWSATVVRLIKLLEKNSFSFFNYRLLPVLWLVTVIPSAWGLAMAGPLLSPLAGCIALVCMLATAVPAILYARRSQIPIAPAVCVPLIWPIAPLILANSTYVTLRQGGIRWRDTFYSLEQLRAGDVGSATAAGRSATPNEASPGEVVGSA